MAALGELRCETLIVHPQLLHLRLQLGHTLQLLLSTGESRLVLVVHLPQFHVHNGVRWAARCKMLLAQFQLQALDLLLAGQMGLLKLLLVSLSQRLTLSHCVIFHSRRGSKLRLQIVDLLQPSCFVCPSRTLQLRQLVLRCGGLARSFCRQSLLLFQLTAQFIGFLHQLLSCGQQGLPFLPHLLHLLCLSGRKRQELVLRENLTVPSNRQVHTQLPNSIMQRRGVQQESFLIRGLHCEGCLPWRP
mmetsp:Transcript_61605/g.132887  ORF Transcript_61605/g.132887 Transcript_61605/m.132887 type:complete len:245 (-) Transcript_61605:42-776(-)